ncbi:MAG: TatD family hydrolase [Pelagibacteraceae bacterium]|jgi:TatD DNase family protein|nr:TatD family hydrolase [Pelagibacteraceae bacterium]MDP6680641.1 TatD family hydrolase [Pelagibacteraceae bacterium]MDP6710665.1 TatD family hydrolase [Pelagibacteraceae bacterium]
MIVDSHCHLDYAELYDQLNEVVKRAVLSQVNYLLTICTTPESFKRILLILKKYKNIYGTYGIHPHETQKYKNIDSSFISKVKKKYKKIIGVGETGLDFFYNHSDKEVQKKSFIEHIKAASELNVPIIVHSRNAETDTYEILKSEEKNSNLKILMHCFTGSKDFAKKLLDINCYISVSGIITFKNSTELSETISSIPIENLLIETDSPYLAPNPYRGKTNEPSFILHTIEKLSQIKQVTKESIMFNTTTNFKKLFNFI